MANDFSSFRIYLQNEYVERCRRNPKYSLRAFARSVGLDNSTLSKIIRGQRAIGQRFVRQIGKRLGLSNEEIEKFINPLTEPFVVNHDEYKILAADRFAVISDWYHYAILELLRVDGFPFAPAQIARNLNITVTEANLALQRLERIGFLEKTDSGYRDLSHGKSSHVEVADQNRACLDNQKQILEKALGAIDSVPYSMRNNTSMTMAIDTSKLEEARSLITSFRRKMDELLGDGQRRNAVYQLAVALFPLSDLDPTHENI